MLELNKIYNEDCLEGMKRIPDGSVDLVVTDPPYNISKLNDKRDRSKLNSPIMRRNKSLNYDFGDWDNMERTNFLEFTKKWLEQCARVLKDGGTIISFFNKEDISYLGWIGVEYELRTRTIFTWHKKNPVPSFRKVNYLSSCEFAWIASKGKKAWTFNFGLQKDMHNFYETSNKSAYGETEHPCEKPVNMIRHFIDIHSNEGQTILDPFMGSGTTAIAAIREKRNFIGFELNKEYWEKANKRIQNELIQGSLF